MALLPDESEILDARLAFPDAQVALDDSTLETLPGLYDCGWYGTSVSRELGSFAVVKRGGLLEDQLGDRVRITNGDRSVVVYVFATASVDYDIHITRRAYAAVSLLSVDRIEVTVEVLSA